MKSHLFTPLKNQNGGLTIDFIFALVLVLGLTGALFALSMTMTVGSITQYITYASARGYFAGHINPENQYKVAENKFNQLVDHPTFSPLYHNGWFIIEKNIPPPSGNLHTAITSRFPEYEANSNHTFFGVYADLNAKMLNFQIPFFGSTTDNNDGFKTIIASYLSREPSTKECQDYNNLRWQTIKNLEVPSGAANYSTGTAAASSQYLPISDNGC